MYKFCSTVLLTAVPYNLLSKKARGRETMAVIVTIMTAVSASKTGVEKDIKLYIRI